MTLAKQLSNIFLRNQILWLNNGTVRIYVISKETLDLNWVLFRTVCTKFQSPQWSHLQSAWPRCMSCQKKNPAKRQLFSSCAFAEILHEFAGAPNLAILPTLPACKHFSQCSHFKRLIKKNDIFPQVPFFVIFPSLGVPLRIACN